MKNNILLKKIKEIKGNGDVEMVTIKYKEGNSIMKEEERNDTNRQNDTKKIPPNDMYKYYLDEARH